MDTTYYIRAYAINEAGVAYGEEITLNFAIPPYVTVPGTNLIVAKEDAGKASHSTAVNMCNSSTLGGFTNWRLPTEDELVILYNNKDLIGGFKDDLYWSSTEWVYHEPGDMNPGYVKRPVWVNFTNGYADNDGYSSDSHYVRCVRTADE